MKEMCKGWVLFLCITLVSISFAGGLISSCKSSVSKVKDVPEENKVVLRNISGLYPAPASTQNGKKWGYIDKTGKFHIQPKYDFAENFQKNGLAIVTLDNLSGIINSEGKYVVEAAYTYIESYSEGLAIAIDKNGYKVLNEAGKIVYQSPDYIGTFHDGRALTGGSDENGNWLYGYIDSNGNVVAKPKYKAAGDFRDGEAIVKLSDNLYELIDKNGQTIKTFNYFFVGDLSEGLMPYQPLLNGKTGYIDEKGKVIIKPQFEIARTFEDGRAVVSNKVNDIYLDGLIDKKGKLILKTKYDNIHPLGEGLWSAGVAIDNKNPAKGYKYAVVDGDGKFLSGFDYTSVSEYSGGCASVSDGSKTYFIDRLGKKASNLPEINGDGSLVIEGELIWANIDSRYIYMDHSGNILWKQSSSLNLTDNANASKHYVVAEEKYKPTRYYLVYYPRISGIENMTVQEAVNKKLKELSIIHTVNDSTEADFSYEGDFTAEFYRKDLLVLELAGYEYHFGAAHGMPFRNYAHVNLKTGRFYELKDLFKKNSEYVKKLGDIIKKQIELKGDEMGVWADSYKGVEPDQPFVITGDALKLYFKPYEIAPYAAGFPTFTIPYRELMDIIDTQGDLWKAFN